MSEPKFIVDNNVGRLAVWLRALGYDTVFINPVDDSQLIEVAVREGRVILTKDTGILERRLVTSGQLPALYVEGTHWRQQLAQVAGQLHLDSGKQFTRCLRCNTALDRCSREEAEVNLPCRIVEAQDSFVVCRTCGRYYWHGSHWKRMRQAMEASLPAPPSTARG